MGKIRGAEACRDSICCVEAGYGARYEARNGEKSGAYYVYVSIFEPFRNKVDCPVSRLYLHVHAATNV